MQHAGIMLVHQNWLKKKNNNFISFIIDYFYYFSIHIIDLLLQHQQETDLIYFNVFFACLCHQEPTLSSPRLDPPTPPHSPTSHSHPPMASFCCLEQEEDLGWRSPFLSPQHLTTSPVFKRHIGSLEVRLLRWRRCVLRCSCFSWLRFPSWWWWRSAALRANAHQQNFCQRTPWRTRWALHFKCLQ